LIFRKLHGELVNFAALAVAAASLFTAYRFLHHPLYQSSVSTVIGLAIALSLLAGLFNYWRLLKMTEAPISTIAAAAQGYIELHGMANTAKPLKTPYHGIPCVWYRVWVYANVQTPGHSQSPEDRRLLEYLESDAPFLLTDNTGTCEVNPKGAEIIFTTQRTFFKNNHRYVEEYLPAGKALYVQGYLDTRYDIVDKRQINQALNATLNDLKSRPQHLLNRYDHDLNGEIDLQEWELARQDAMQQVQAKLAMRSHQGSFTLSKPKDAHVFLITAKSPQALSAAYKRWVMVHSLVLAGLLLLWAKYT
jgi:hypothetical protein